MTIVNPSINPVGLQGYPLGYTPLNDVTSFTYRTGAGQQEILESIRAWIPNVLIPYLTTNLNMLDGAIVDDVNNLIDAVDTAIAAQADTVNTALSTQSTAINDALAAQQTAVNQQLAATLAGLAGGSINVTDPVIANAVNTSSSQTRTALAALFAAKATVDALVTLTGTGRLSQSSLDSAYNVTDADIAAFVTNATSATRTAFNNAYQKIQFQVANGYIQWKYQGDVSWTNLENLSDLMGAVGPTGTPGAPGGAAELAYAEVASGGTITVATGSGQQDIPGMTLSFTMPARPIMLEFQGLIRYVSSNGNGSDAAVQIVETTGGGSTIVAEFHSGVAQGSGDYKEVHGKRRLTGTAGTVRSFKVTCRKDAAVAWTLSPASAFPVYAGAYQV